MIHRAITAAEYFRDARYTFNAEEFRNESHLNQAPRLGDVNDAYTRLRAITPYAVIARRDLWNIIISIYNHAAGAAAAPYVDRRV